MGVSDRLVGWDWEGAVQEYRRALALNPGDSFTRGMCAVLLALLGRPNESVAEARGSVERDPLSVFNRHVLALVLYLDRRYEAAIAEARAGLELDQSSHFLYWDLGYSSTFLGRHDEAVTALRHATSLAPEDPFSLGYLGWALGVAGHRQEALAIREDLERRQDHAYAVGVLVAWVSLGLGENEQAITSLHQAVEQRDGRMTHLNRDPLFDPPPLRPSLPNPPPPHEFPRGGGNTADSLRVWR